MAPPEHITEQGDSALIAVRLTPRAARDEIAGVREGRLLVRVSAPAIEDRANRTLRRLIAAAFAVAPSRVDITRGGRGRDKLVRIEGLSGAEAARRLGDPRRA